VGGVGTIVGPIIGAFFYAISKEFFARTLPELHVFAFGILFIFVVLFSPGGLVEMTTKVRRLTRMTTGTEDKNKGGSRFARK